MTFFASWIQAPKRLAVLAAFGVLTVILSVCPARARAWNGTGHMIVAEIAYDHLTPHAKSRVDALLARHRDYAKWMSQMPAGYTDRARYAFLVAATWPDLVRKTPDDRPIWHYIDTPVIAPGYTPDPAAILTVKPNAETQIVAKSDVLADPKASDMNRAVALCWVEHLVGDVHQPLHDASLFSALFPKGDRGGNSEHLKAAMIGGDPVEKSAHPRNLHALWDDAFGNTQDPAQIQKIAATLQTPAYAPRTYPQLRRDKTVLSWVMEGNVLARKFAYQNATLPMTPNAQYHDADTTLPPGYLPMLHRISDRQVALAGLRLAALLNAQPW